MSYRFEKNPVTGKPELVIDNFQQAIGSSPYMQSLSNALGNVMTPGLSDMRNMNIISIPGEASVNFSTSQTSFSSFSGSVASADATADTVTYSGETGTPVARMAVVFAGGSLPAGISAGTQSAAADTNVYWIGNINTSAKTFKVYTDPGLSSLVNITGNGTGTFATINMTQPRHSTYDTTTPAQPVYYIIDASGRVWKLNTNWVFMGNTTRANGNGNGISYYYGYIFAYRNKRIDYMTISSGVWAYGWDPSSGSAGGDAFNTGAGVANSHHAIVGQDNVTYICDSSYLASFFQKVGQTFDPTSTATYTWAQKALGLPVNEIAQWLTELGINLLVLGQRNLIYPWNRTATSYTFPIFLSEDAGYANLAAAIPIYPKMVTVNTNTYIFTGNRGRIFVTNGTNAQLYAKIPDHLSGTIEPYYYWGGVGYNKNQLYFGAYVTKNDATAITAYGGLWAIDLDTRAMRLVNILSYATYAGYCSLYIANPAAAAGGSFFAGWDSGASTYGIDSSSSTPYTNYQSYLDSDMLPLGTFLTPYTPSEVEFKLTTPLVSGEGIKMQYRTNITEAYIDITNSEFTAAGTISGLTATNFEKEQWVQLRVLTKSTASTPSYARLKEIRMRQ